MGRLLLCSILFLAAAGTASAQNTLLVTDVLAPGIVDLQAEFLFRHAARKMKGNVEGDYVAQSAVSVYSLGVGLLPDLEMRMQIPYLFRDRRDFGTFETVRSGVGDLLLGTRFSMCDERLPYRATAGVDVKLDTADETEGGTGTTDIAPTFAVSRRFGDLIPYLFYQPVLRNKGAADIHGIGIGIERLAGELLQLDGNIGLEIPASSGAPLACSLNLAAYIGLNGHLWILPGLSLRLESSYDTIVFDPSDPDTPLEVRFDGGGEITGTVSLYYIF